ncbi:probable F-box protein At4g22030 [Ziziphus jujuba]|uniref:Probable F-box protein At4g22030 n=1 Tax=Ziziphus jujuba TaxID=326968 RepID=A0A6P4AU44_ZIZJJ|nr:probable F-box protein At4g22030 [Ziziphus jujuba]
MATLQASFCSSSSSSSLRKIKYTLHHPKLQSSKVSVPNIFNNNEVVGSRQLPNLTTASTHDIHTKPKIVNKTRNTFTTNYQANSNPEVVQELYAILEIVADRIEMHKNIGAQRDNWNGLLLNSVNGMTVTASIMAGLGALNGSFGATLLALKLSSGLLYMAATLILLVMNKIQPSQLAEEQRNASRLFKQIYEEIRTTLALRIPNSNDVNDLMQKVLALDKAYPLPLLGAMLDKYPSIVKPAVWWPKEKPEHEIEDSKVGENGWNEKLEEEMKEIVGVVRRKDSEEYVRLSKMALKVSKVLAFSGPLLTGFAAVGSVFMGLPGFGSWGTFFGVVFGALATVVNSLEHGGQIGMVFEMYRSSAGFYKHMEEIIDSNLKEGEVDKRENGELFEVKVALQLGRSLSELRDLASASSLSSRIQKAKEEYASKLF